MDELFYGALFIMEKHYLKYYGTIRVPDPKKSLELLKHHPWQYWTLTIALYRRFVLRKFLWPQKVPYKCRRQIPAFEIFSQEVELVLLGKWKQIWHINQYDVMFISYFRQVGVPYLKDKLDRYYKDKFGNGPVDSDIFHVPSVPQDGGQDRPLRRNVSTSFTNEFSIPRTGDQIRLKNALKSIQIVPQY